jgi:EAL domain-containing protein (putative c-di-GMP-specific phosphodiesterase class I)
VASPAFGHTFLDRCAQFGADPARMVVEITETDLLAPGAVSLANMQQLRHAGTHVSIDDFGTGYSSLAHLLELPVDGVKIDRRFVAGIDVDLAATNLTTAILGLSQSLGLTCVAEGVEQPYQRDRLGARGCVAFQGWLFAPALPADEVLEMLPRIVPTISDDAPRPTPLTN